MITKVCFCWKLRNALLIFTTTEMAISLLGFYTVILCRLFFNFVPRVTFDDTTSVILYIVLFALVVMSSSPLALVLIFSPDNMKMTIVTTVVYIPAQVIVTVLFLYKAYFVQQNPETAWDDYVMHSGYHRHLTIRIVLVVLATANFFYLCYKLLVVGMHVCRKWEEYQSYHERAEQKRAGSAWALPKGVDVATNTSAHEGQLVRERSLAFGEMLLGPEESEATVKKYAYKARTIHERGKYDILFHQPKGQSEPIQQFSRSARLASTAVMAGLPFYGDKVWGIFLLSIKLILSQAKRSSPLVYGHTNFENSYNFYVAEVMYVIIGSLFIIAIKLVRNAYSVLAVVGGCCLTALHTVMKLRYVNNFYRDPLKYNVCGKYHLFGQINYKNQTMFPITNKELMAEQVFLTMHVSIEVLVAVLLILMSILHARFIMYHFYGVNTIDPSKHRERRASYQPPVKYPDGYQEIEEIM